MTLREPGAEPRCALSYHPRAVVPAPRFTLGEPGKAPDLTLTLSWQPDGNAKPPRLRYRFSISGAKAPDAGNVEASVRPCSSATSS